MHLDLGTFNMWLEGQPFQIRVHSKGGFTYKETAPVFFSGPYRLVCVQYNLKIKLKYFRLHICPRVRRHIDAKYVYIRKARILCRARSNACICCL